MKRMNNYLAIVTSNAYINKPNVGNVDIHSFGYLTNSPLPQSQNIMLGHCMENFFRDVVVTYATGWESIKTKNTEGQKERDHIYKNSEAKRIIYAEQKDNINLDTEKSRSTVAKVLAIIDDIKKLYPDYTVDGYIFAARYLSNGEDVAKKIIGAKYSGANVIGVNEYLGCFGLTQFKDYTEYKGIIAEICKLKFTGAGATTATIAASAVPAVPAAPKKTVKNSALNNALRAVGLAAAAAAVGAGMSTGPTPLAFGSTSPVAKNKVTVADISDNLAALAI